MTRTIPAHVHSFECTGISEAITFHFKPTTDGKDPIGRVFGWALATVNNQTGELAIQSDWGNWSYRWHVNALGSVHNGRQATLIEFISARDAGHCDYLADKLVSYVDRNQFDSYKTVSELRRRLIARRVEAARTMIEHFADDEDPIRDVLADPPNWIEGVMIRDDLYPHREEKWPFDKDTVRSVYDRLGDLEGEDDPDRFLEKYGLLEGRQMVTDEPWEHLQYAPSPHYYQLLHGILPALVRACAERVKAEAV